MTKYRLAWYDEASGLSSRGNFMFTSSEKVMTIALESGLTELGARRSEPCVRFWVEADDEPNDRSPKEIAEEAARRRASSR